MINSKEHFIIDKSTYENSNLILNSGYSFYGNIDGSIISGFEYFYTLWELRYLGEDGFDKSDNRHVYWGFLNINLNFSYIKDFIKQKYKNIDDRCFDYMIYVDIKKPYRFNKILFFDYYSLIYTEESCILGRKLYALSGSTFKSSRNVKYYIEYNHLKPDGLDLNYKSKFRFDLLRDIDKHDRKTLVTSHDCVLKLRRPNFIQRKSFVSPLFYDKFDRVIYIQNKDSIDIKPRLFHECRYFKIKVKFISKDIKDGAYYRYNEAKSENIYQRQLRYNDEIIQELISFND